MSEGSCDGANRQADLAKVSAFGICCAEQMRRIAFPRKILKRHPKPSHHRRPTVPPTIIAMAITSPRDLTREGEAGFLTKAVAVCCHVYSQSI